VDLEKQAATKAAIVLSGLQNRERAAHAAALLERRAFVSGGLLRPAPAL